MTDNVTAGMPEKPTRFLDSLLAVRADSTQTAGRLGTVVGMPPVPTS